MRSRLIRYLEKNDKVKQRRDPENYVEDQRAEEFCEYYLPVAHRDSCQWFDRAELKFLGKQSHRDERKNQNEREPEKNRIEKCLLDRVLHLALVHEGDLKIKIDPANYLEEDEHDVRNGRMEITADFARKESVKFSHKSKIEH
jgi:hypothetical protein